ncbi:MAG: tetratricopeptide repeat protein, partial [Promethearchaeota archaeon]
LAEALFAERMLFFMIFSIIPFKWDENWKNYMKKGLIRCNESLKLAENCDDPYILGSIFSMVGSWFCAYGFQFMEDEIKQREYTEKGLELMEKGLAFSKKSKNTILIINSLWWLNWLAISIRKFEFVQHRIPQDLQEIEELGKIFSKSYIIWHYYSNLLPAFYYATVSHRSFFTLDQRKSYAKKGLEYAEKALIKLAFRPYFGWPYQMSTWSYSQLVNLDISKEKREEFINNMLQSAFKAKEIGEKYKGGFARAVGYSSLFRAYKTLSDNATSKKEKVEMLTAAIDASEKNMEHAVWSRTGIIAAQMRLGLLYEELGITTSKIENLMKVKEIYLNVISNCYERGYHSYAAAAHEYIAHIEDRMGKFTNSSQHYKKARDAYSKSLKFIEYRLLKNKIEEKINYTQAWNFIEKAKEYHKRENHSNAINNYENASKILKELPSFNYESSYYATWALQEKAEQYSKSENQKEAIENFESTKDGFEFAIKDLEEAYVSSKNKEERLRIEKLKKLAQIRAIYCAARIDLENARMLGKQGRHIASAEKFASAALQLNEVCTHFHVEQERRELEANFYLCKAWESMEYGEEYEEPHKFVEAAKLFTKASNLFTETKLKFLALGNSAFCQALECGTNFDKTADMKVKSQLYTKIKSMLRNAASSYRKGGFESGADWALATSTFFDAIWHLINVDEELDFTKKKELLEIGSMYLKSAADLFSKAKYKDKEREVLEQLEMVKKEESILISAMNTIKKPSISGSTIGISAPACPLEASLSPNLSEVHKLTEAETVIKEKREIKEISKLKEIEKIESEIKVEDQKFICIVHKGHIVGTVYICPNCKTCYCLTCAYSLKANGEKCWTCNNEINP